MQAQHAGRMAPQHVSASPPSSGVPPAIWSSGSTSTPTPSPALFRRRLHSERQPDHAAALYVGHFRGGLFHAPDRRLAVRHDCRSLRPAEVDDDLRSHDVRRVSARRSLAHVWDDRHCCASASARGAPDPGPVGWRRIRHVGHLHERGGACGAAWFLQLLPICDAHRRSAAGVARDPGPAAAARRRNAASMGMAHSLCAGRPRGSRRVPLAAYPRRVRVRRHPFEG